jgi:hypothetical protein
VVNRGGGGIPLATPTRGTNEGANNPKVTIWVSIEEDGTTRRLEVPLDQVPEIRERAFELSRLIDEAVQSGRA